MKTRLSILSLCVAMVCGEPALGEEADGGWSYRINPYLWMPGMSGSVRLGSLPGVSVDIGSQSVLDMADLGFAGTFEARRGNAFVMIDGSYAALSDSRNLIITRISTDITTAYAGVIGGYRVTRDLPLDIYAGGRYHSVKADVSGSGLGSESKSVNKIEPLAGVRVTVPAAERLNFNFSVSAGGFGIQSFMTWEMWPMLEYQFSDSIAGMIGYRYKSISFDKNAFRFDVDSSGLVMGLGISL